MKHLFDTLSKDCSVRVTQTYSTSFSTAVRLLSPKIRTDIHAIYGFVRFADEIVDSFHEYPKKDLLDEFERDLYLSLYRGISLNPILNSFQATVAKYQIDHSLIDAFMKSMRADLAVENYETVEQYEDYIYGSADVVGLMCLKVFVNGDKEKYEQLKPAAMKLGSAFQKVNFLRDIKDDMLGLNRNYFPYVKEGRLTPETKKMIVDDIENDFNEAYKGIVKLPMEARFGVYTAFVYYRRLLGKLKATRASEIHETRIRVSDPMKMVLLTKSFVNYKLNLL